MKKGLGSLLDSISGKTWVELALDSYSVPQEPPRAIEEFHPHLAGQCPRFIQFDMAGLVGGTITARTRRIFQVGHQMHERYAEYFRHAGLLFDTEVYVRKEIDGIVIEGSTDLVLLHPDTKAPVIGELKSINDRGYNDLVIPHDNHFLQWNLYATCFGAEDGVIIYENKNNQEYKAFLVKASQARFQECVDIFKMIKDANAKNEIVPRPKRCPNRYCSMTLACKEC